ncbi:TPA: hypothetical protein ACVGIU_000100 [Pseudomonas aeruginosa]|nr:hypothetical protein [Pseudomonas aeruginosa]
MTKANECTCPSGDGSLRHPCPAHPASVEQAGGDEREEFEAWMHTFDLPPQLDGETFADERYLEDACFGQFVYDDPLTQRCWAAWQARAALAQPSPKCATCNDLGHVCLDWEASAWEKCPDCAQAGERSPMAVMAEALRDKARQEQQEYQDRRAQAEAERPSEHDLEAAGLGYPLSKEAAVSEWRRLFNDAGNALKNALADLANARRTIENLETQRDAALVEVERLRQFERICEGLPQDAIDGGWTVQGIRCYAKRLEDQLKSALARVAELTANRNRYGVDAHYFNKNLQRILRDFESFTPDELARSLIILAKVADEKVVAQHSVPEGFIGRLSEFLAQRGATGKALLRELRDMLAAAPARGQHSVPEEFSFEYRHPNGECHTVTVSREQVINEMPDFLFEALCSKFCNCEPVGETNVVECRCDEYAEEFKLLAAAPGKEGL